MQIENKIFCHWDWVRFVTENKLINKNGEHLTLSVTEGNEFELMIFLGRDDSDSCYEVRVYKNKASDKYIPHETDNVKHYEENDEYATFIFDEYDNALCFVDFLGCYHKEYIVRPAKKIEG